MRDRLAELVGRPKHVTFSGCSNRLSTRSKQEGNEMSLLPEAHWVPAGSGRIELLQEQGWTYSGP